jgi:hypothetical protein
VVPLLPNIGHELKVFVLASPFLNQVNLDFCLALLFSIAANPMTLNFRVLRSCLSSLLRCLDS